MKKKRPFKKHLSSLVALIFSVLCSSPGAQTFPDKPLRLIVPYTAGGITDSLSRNLAELLRQDFKQPVIVENKPGANTAIGAQILANSKPDGYTMLFITPATVVTNPLLNSKLAYDPDRDFVVVARFAEIPLLAVVSVDSTIRSLGDLIAQAKAKPGTFNYGSTGTGIAVPANTPKDIVLTLNHAISRASENKEFRVRFEPLGVLFASSMSPTQIDASIKAEREQWGRIIKTNNLQVN